MVNKYQELRIWSFQHNGESVEEYERRYNSPATLHTDLKINPIQYGERSSESYELFMVPIPKVLQLDNVVHDNSRKIANLTARLPGIAFEQLFISTLRAEIMSTNEIEDVKTTNQEVSEAITNVDSDRKIRFQSFAKMYFKIKDRENLKIKELEDIRRIYDDLLKGEIADDKLPDGELFRNTYARIGSDTETVHLPKSTEAGIKPDLIKWINFINSETPSLFKALIAHYYFEYVHPFNDGNGRLGRYIACVYLGYKLDPLTAIIFSREINDNRKTYYKSFINVEDPKNYGEVTFFVKDMLSFLIKGQKKLIKDLQDKQVMLDYVGKKIAQKFEKLEAECLFLYFQAYLFDDYTHAMEDRKILEVVSGSKHAKAAIKRCIKELEQKKLIKTIKKSPLTRRLTSQFVEELIND